MAWQPKHKRTGPFILEAIDDSDETYLKLTFSDGNTRKMAKGGKWPPHLAVQLYEKAKEFVDKKVYIVTSQTTKAWDPEEWICDIRPPEIEEQEQKFERILGEDVLGTPTANNKTYVEYTFVQGQFKYDSDAVDFKNRLIKEFDASWHSPKHARVVDTELDIRRFRFGKCNLSKQKGYRVTAFKAYEQNGWSWVIILQLDEKLKDGNKSPDQKEMVAKANELINGDRSPERMRQIFDYLSKKRSA